MKNRNETNNNNNNNATKLNYNEESVEVLFERPKSVEETRKALSKEENNRINDDKYKSTADGKNKSRRIATADNIDLKLGGLMPKMMKTVENIR